MLVDGDAEPTMQLRFVERSIAITDEIGRVTRILQQLWRVTDLNAGLASPYRYEWRDVPLETE